VWSRRHQCCAALVHGHFTWLIVGLVAGTLASVASRGTGFGILRNIVLGIVTVA
jgi:uncharacterized membrane protein YeaQ/YmgE (transglycosylase-associated protein family)